MDRPAWEHAFLAELVRLRPHMLDTDKGAPNRPAFALAATLYKPDLDPKVTAQRWHARAPAVKTGATRRGGGQ